MFTLRRISETGLEINHFLGDTYVFVHHQANIEEFAKHFQNEYGKAPTDELDDDEKRVYAFVLAGPFIQPLYKKQRNFIMTEGGTTFDNLSFR